MSPIYIKIDGFPGEATAKGHEDEIEVLSFSWGLSNSSSIVIGGGGGAGKASFKDFSFTNVVHKSSPKLMLACASGQHIDNAVLTIRKAGESPVDYLKLTFEEVFVSSFDQAGDEGGDRPVENLTLAFFKVKFDYTPQKDDGSLGTLVHAGWDLAQNKST